MSHKKEDQYLPVIGTKKGGHHNYDGYIPVLGPSGTLSPTFLPPGTGIYRAFYEVEDEQERLELAGTAKIGDLCKQQDTRVSYILKQGTGASLADWIIVGTEAANTSSTGEINIGANIGSAGTGVYDGKADATFHFKKLNAASPKISITDNTDQKRIDFDVNLTTDDIAEGTKKYYNPVLVSSYLTSIKGTSLGIAGLNSSQQVPAINLPQVVVSKSITVEDPTNAENISVFYTTTQLVVVKVIAQVQGSNPSLTWSLRFGPDRTLAGTELVITGIASTGQSVVTSFNSSMILANSFIWLTTTAKSGIVTSIHLTIVYK